MLEYQEINNNQDDETNAYIEGESKEWADYSEPMLTIPFNDNNPANGVFAGALIGAFKRNKENFGANALRETLQDSTEMDFSPSDFDDVTYNIIFSYMNQLQDFYSAKGFPADVVKQANRDNLYYIYSNSSGGNALTKERVDDLEFKSQQIFEAYCEAGLKKAVEIWHNTNDFYVRRSLIKPFFKITEEFFDCAHPYKFNYDSFDSNIGTVREKVNGRKFYSFNLAYPMDKILITYVAALQSMQSDVDAITGYSDAVNWYLFDTLETSYEEKEMFGNPIMQDAYYLTGSLSKKIRAYVKQSEKSHLFRLLKEEYEVFGFSTFLNRYNNAKADMNAVLADKYELTVDDLKTIYKVANNDILEYRLDLEEATEMIIPLYERLGERAKEKGICEVFKDFNPERFAFQEKVATQLVDALKKDRRYSIIQAGFARPRFNDAFWLSDLCTQKDGLFDVFYDAVKQTDIADKNVTKIVYSGVLEEFEKLSYPRNFIYNRIPNFFFMVQRLARNYYYDFQNKEQNPLVMESYNYSPEIRGPYAENVAAMGHPAFIDVYSYSKLVLKKLADNSRQRD